MAREILFRGKRVDTGQWIIGSFIPDLRESLYGEKEIDGYIKPFGKTKQERMMVEIDRNTVGQYIGLKDCSGKRIFEGDIVKHYNDSRHPYNFEIGAISWNGKLCKFVRGSSSWFCEIHSDCIYEVIGNIYDSPELLNGIET